MKPKNRNGLTVIEVIVALLAIALLLAITLPYLNRQHQEQWRHIADTEPWRAFAIECKAEKETFLLDELATILCAVRNTTRYPLEFKFNAFAIRTEGSATGLLAFWTPLESRDETTTIDQFTEPRTTNNGVPEKHGLLPGDEALYRLALVGGKFANRKFESLYGDLTGPTDYFAKVIVADKNFLWSKNGVSFESPVFKYRVAPANLSNPN